MFVARLHHTIPVITNSTRRSEYSVHIWKCMFHLDPPSSRLLSPFLLSLHLWIARRLFPQFSYLFSDFPRAISLSASPAPVVLPPPSTLSFPLSLSLSLVDLAPVSFPLVHPSVCRLFFFLGGGELISFPISPSYMLGEAPCMGVNEGAAWVNPQGDG